jgi:hypothetical protein
MNGGVPDEFVEDVLHEEEALLAGAAVLEVAVVQQIAGLAGGGHQDVGDVSVGVGGELFCAHHVQFAQVFEQLLVEVGKPSQLFYYCCLHLNVILSHNAHNHRIDQLANAIHLFHYLGLFKIFLG